MKKLLFTLALLMQTVFLFAAAPRQTATVSYNNVKMYRQAGTSTEVLKNLKSTDELVVVRRHNANWTIVTLNNEVGYVLTSELTLKKAAKNMAMNKFNRKGNYKNI
ncbi:MAG: hypothetical protein JWQ14_2651 [Adhaeribacter sp.]|nr:hypothetical protein [Adhaeribacter sp.]